MGIEKGIRESGDVLWDGVKKTTVGSFEYAINRVKESRGTELLGTATLELPLMIPLRIMAISAKTALKVAGIMGWETLKTAGNIVSALPVFPASSAERMNTATNAVTHNTQNTRRSLRDLFRNNYTPPAS